jgi:hypothetical protein
VDGEALAILSLTVVDGGAVEMLEARRIDDDVDAGRVEDVVAFLWLVQREPIAHAGAAAGLGVEPETALGQLLLLASEMVLHFLGGGVSHLNHRAFSLRLARNPRVNPLPMLTENGLLPGRGTACRAPTVALAAPTPVSD